MELKIRRLAQEDASLAVDVVKSFASKDVSLHHMERFLSNPANYLIVAEDGRKLVGFLLGYALDRLKENSHKMFIYEIEVAEVYRRKGIGTGLISQILEIVKRMNMMNAFVITNYSNEGAVEFYKSTGAEIENGDDVLFVFKG